jgi:hypothetical protein
MAYYGHFYSCQDVGNITSGEHLFFGTTSDPNFSASRLYVPFHSIQGDAIPAERPQADKISSLIGKNIRGTYQIVAGDWSVESDVGTMQEFVIEVLCKSCIIYIITLLLKMILDCGDGIYNPWHEQCDQTRGCNNETCACLDDFRNRTGSCGECLSMSKCDVSHQTNVLFVKFFVHATMEWLTQVKNVTAASTVSIVCARQEQCRMALIVWYLLIPMSHNQTQRQCMIIARQ